MASKSHPLTSIPMRMAKTNMSTARLTNKLQPQFASIRCLSASARGNAAKDAAPAAPEPVAGASTELASGDKLPWPEYFKIRKNKRTWEMATTPPMAIMGLGAGLAYFGSLDGTSQIMGIDPMFVYGLATLGCGATGWLFGPFVGGSFWRMSHRNALARIEDRDRTFHHHIVKNRADPSRQSAMNPVPDFYGEKVGSLSQYRQWLRDQGKYRRKAMWSEELEKD